MAQNARPNESTDESTGHPPTPEFAPGEIESALNSFDRRSFLKLMGASLAMAGTAAVTGCASPQPPEKIEPYVRSPEGSIPGIPRFYATTLPANGWLSGFGRGVIVEQHEGRPTKIEGNPDHPSSLGATDIFMQAAVLQFYDPDRSKTCQHANQPISWGGLLGELQKWLVTKTNPTQLRVRLLTGTITSPTLAAQIRDLQQLLPQFVWHVDDILTPPAARDAQQQSFGRPLTPVYDLSKARRIVSLDSHFLAEEPGSLRYAREFASGRRLPFQPFGPNQTHRSTESLSPPRPPLTPDTMARLHMAECSLTFTGAIADHRLPIKPSLLPAIAAALAHAIAGTPASTSLPAEVTHWIQSAAADLKTAPTESLVIAGPHQRAEVHAIAHAINQFLGAVGNTVHYVEPVDFIPTPPAQGDNSLQSLITALNADEVDLLIILECNPAFTAPADLNVSDALKRFTSNPTRLALHIGPYIDETAPLCHLHIPLSHPLESWGDLRAHDGTASIIQPLIEPLWQTKSAIESLAALQSLLLEILPSTVATFNSSAADRFATGYERVRRHWLDQWQNLPPDDRDLRWRKSLRDGLIENTASTPITLDRPADLQKILLSLPAPPPSSTAIEILFRPDPTLADGAWANHPWLQELPKPITHVTWENVALIAPQTAQRLGIDPLPHQARDTTPGLRITAHGHTIDLPAWVQPGHPEETITLHLGGGRRAAGSIQRPDDIPIGTDIYPLRTTQHLASAAGTAIQIQKSSTEFLVANTQPRQSMEDRDIARSRPISQLPPPSAPIQSPDLYSTRIDKDGTHIHLSLYDENRYAGYKWGMVIDLAACIGCNACVVACQAENNIPTVGKEQVRRGREMHWIRIDTYILPNSSANGHEFRLQPMLCQHCENAPCEVVCPVEATSHSDEGINEMTYNRCVGTRYCSNNCPYKVRRFNFFQYNSHDTLTLNMQKNPNVTVRSRGVMEKCSYCIQRINRARIDAKRAWARSETDPLAPKVEMRATSPDGWVNPADLPRLRFQTACQQACPTQAIIFGDLNDTASLVSLLKTQSPWAHINYGVLTELNTQPRTSYLERLTNPTPIEVSSSETPSSPPQAQGLQSLGFRPPTPAAPITGGRA